MQRGQHAGSGLGTVSRTARCRSLLVRASSQWPPSCGLNSAHPTLALRNLLQFANSLRERSMLPCFCIARQTQVLPCKMRPSSLLVAVPRLGGLGHQNLLQAFFACRGGCICSQLRLRLPDGGRMSSGSAVVDNHWAQAPCRHSPTLCRGASMPLLGSELGPMTPPGDSTMPFVAG